MCYARPGNTISDPIPYPWTLAVSESGSPWRRNTDYEVWRCRERGEWFRKQCEAAESMKQYRLVPWPITGTC
jgi:hypothetical protein